MQIQYDDVRRQGILKEDETMDDLQLCGLRLIQKKNGFRLGMDSVLLADFARIRSTDRVADFGTGTGALPLLLMGRKKGAEYYAFEIQRELAVTAARTMIINGLEEKVHIFLEDAGNASKVLPSNYLDAVVANPPYGEPGNTLKNPSEVQSISRHQEQDTIARWLRAAYLLLRGRGRIFLVYPASGMLFPPGPRRRGSYRTGSGWAFPSRCISPDRKRQCPGANTSDKAAQGCAEDWRCPA